MNARAIQIEQVEKSYGSFPVLEGVTGNVGEAREVLMNPQSDRLQIFLSRMNQAARVRT